MMQLANCFKLVAVCDIDPRKLELLEIDETVARYTCIDDLINHAHFELGVVCTPSGFHADHTIKLAMARKHVVTEKPMATTLEGAVAMAEACQRHQVKLFVVKQNRFNPAVRAVKAAIDAGEFGRIYLIQTNLFWSRSQAYFDSASWRGTHDLDGGAVMNQGSHYIDIMRWFVGEVADVQAMYGTLGRNIEAEDTAVANLRFESGALGSVSLTLLSYQSNYEGSITLMGEKGTVKIGGVALNQIEKWTSDKERGEGRFHHRSESSIVSVYGSGHQSLYRNISDTIWGRDDMLISGDDGIRCVEIMTAMRESAHLLRPVTLRKMPYAFYPPQTNGSSMLLPSGRYGHEFTMNS